MYQFSDKMENFEFLGPNLPRINNSKIPCVPIFSQNGQLLIFRSELRKLHNYMQYFGSNIVEGGGWSWVMEMGAWFSNTSSENRR